MHWRHQSKCRRTGRIRDQRFSVTSPVFPQRVPGVSGVTRSAVEGSKESPTQHTRTDRLSQHPTQIPRLCCCGVSCITSDYPERAITDTMPVNRPTGTAGYPDVSSCALSTQAVGCQAFQACTLVCRPPGQADRYRGIVLQPAVTDFR